MPLFRASSLCLCLLLGLALLASGCVQRRLMVRSNPAGAQVYIDDQPVGQTPVSVPFTYYGTRSFRLEKDGFETLVTKHEVRAPWYQYPPLDFVSENLWPREVRDERVVDFQLEPQKIVPTQHLLDRAESLRRATVQGYAAPLPGANPWQGWTPPASGFPPGQPPLGPPPNPNAPPGF